MALAEETREIFKKVHGVINDFLAIKPTTHDAEVALVFLRKILFHSRTVVLLLDQPWDQIDPFSILALIRIIADALGVMAYLVDQSVDLETRFLRWCVWRLHGLLKRQSFPSLSRRNNEQQREERRTIRTIRDRIKSLAPYHRLRPSAQQRILRGEPEAFKIVADASGDKVEASGFSDRAELVGFGARYAVHRFAYASGHVHAGYEAIIQVQQLNEAQRFELAEAVPNELLILLAYAIKIAGATSQEMASKLLDLPRELSIYFTALRELGDRVSRLWLSSDACSHVSDVLRMEQLVAVSLTGCRAASLVLSAHKDSLANFAIVDHSAMCKKVQSFEGE
jgi:hypothetical protein